MPEFDIDAALEASDSPSCPACGCHELYATGGQREGTPEARQVVEVICVRCGTVADFGYALADLVDRQGNPLVVDACAYDENAACPECHGSYLHSLRLDVMPNWQTALLSVSCYTCATQWYECYTYHGVVDA